MAGDQPRQFNRPAGAGEGKLLKITDNSVIPLYNSLRPSHGEPVKRNVCVSLIVFCLALLGSASARSSAKYNQKSNHPQVSKQARKQAKSYNKELKKAQKHQNKLQKKQMKAWQKQHPGTRSVTGRD